VVRSSEQDMGDGWLNNDHGLGIGEDKVPVLPLIRKFFRRGWAVLPEVLLLSLQC
jgi:hypothetical protein